MYAGSCVGLCVKPVCEYVPLCVCCEIWQTVQDLFTRAGMKLFHGMCS